MDKKTSQPRYLIQPISCPESKEIKILYLIIDCSKGTDNPIKIFRGKPGILKDLYKWFEKYRVSMFSCHLSQPKEVDKKQFKKYLLEASTLE